MRLVNTLPFQTQLSVGQLLGRILFTIAPKRRHVVYINLKLCFPELDEPSLKKMVKQVFIENGIGIIETAMAWWSSREGFRQRVTIEGKEHLEEALSKGRGVILLGAHTFLHSI